MTLKWNYGFPKRLFSDIKYMENMCGDKEEYVDLRAEIGTIVQDWYS